MVNYQSRTVAEILVLLVVVLSGTTILTLSMSTNSLDAPLLISAAALIAAIVASASILLPEVKGAPWVPTSKRLVGRVLTLAELKPGELLYDLGSGDGRIVIAAARDFGARSVGIEIDPFRVFYSRQRISQLGLREKASIVRGDLFKVNLKDADVVVLYLLQHTNDRIQTKLESELKPDCRVVSVVWKFEGWDLIKADYEEMIYVYRPGPKPDV